MKKEKSNSLLLGLTIFLTITLAALAILTAIKLRTEKPVAPTVPQAKPKAVEVNVNPKCQISFQMPALPTLTPTPTTLVTPTATPTGVFTPTPTDTPTPTSTPTNTPVPTGVSTNTPAPTSTPIPTNTPGPTNATAPTLIAEASPIIPVPTTPVPGISLPTILSVIGGTLLVILGLIL